LNGKKYMSIKNKKLNTGFSTIELLVAFAILIINITGILLLTSGSQGSGTEAVIGQGQKISISSETNQEALYMAQKQMEEKRADSRSDFLSINTYTNPIDETSGPITYKKNLIVTDISPCLKQVTSSLSWNSSKLPIELSTLITDVAGALALGGDCLSDPPGAGGSTWKNPYADCNDKDAKYCASIGGSAATDIDVLEINGKKIAFLTSSTGTSGKPDFWIFDVTNSPPNDPAPLLWSLDTGDGLNSVDVAKGPDGHYYAYVAGYSEDSKGSPCGGGISHKPYSKQFQIIDIDVTNFANSSIVASITPSAVDVCGEFPAGYSIYYYNNKVYMGTKETKGNELMIFDVSNLTNIKESSISVKRNVNKIFVRNNLAYLATGSGALEKNPFKIYNVDPTSTDYKKEIGSLTTSTKVGEGTSVFLLGNKIYLGLKQKNSADEFFILDVKTTSAVTVLKSIDFDQKLCIDNPTKPNDKKSCIGPGNHVSGIVVTGPLAFLVSNYSTGGFQAWNISNVSNIENLSMYNYSEKATGIDYLNNKIYVSNESNNGLRIIIDKP